MALQEGPSGYYGVMLHNKKDLSEEQVKELCSKYGALMSFHQTPKKLVFVEYKEYSEARTFLDDLQNDINFSARVTRQKTPEDKRFSYRNKPALRVRPRSSSMPSGRRQGERKVRFNAETESDCPEASSTCMEETNNKRYQSRKKRNDSGGQSDSSSESSVDNRSPKGYRGDYIPHYPSLLPYPAYYPQPGPDYHRYNSGYIRQEERYYDRRSRTYNFPPDFGPPKPQWRKDYRQPNHIRGHFFQIPNKPPDDERLIKDPLEIDHQDQNIYYDLKNTKKLAPLYEVLFSDLPLWFMMGDVLSLCWPICYIVHVDFSYSRIPNLPPFAVVHVKSWNDAKRLIKQLNGFKIDRKRIQVEEKSNLRYNRHQKTNRRLHEVDSSDQPPQNDT